MLPGSQTRRPVEIDQLDLKASSCNPAPSHELEDTATLGLLWTLDLRGYREDVSGERGWWERLEELTPQERAALAAELVADLADDDPMITTVHRLLGVQPPDGDRTRPD